MRSQNFWKVFSACVFLLSFCLSSEAVSVRAVDCEVRDVLLGIAAESGVGLLLDDSVSGKITLRVDGLNFDDALQLIADAKGLQYQKKRDNLYIVGLHLNGRKNAYIFPVRHLTKEQILADAGALLGAPEKKDALVFDETAHALLFFGAEQEAQRLRSHLAHLDVAPRQVVLEAKVLSLENSAAEKLGISWEWSKFPQTPEREQSETTRRTSVWNPDEGKYESVYETIPKEKVTRKWKSGENIPGIIKLGRGYEMYYAAKLDALFSKGKAEVLARPNVIALDGKEAQIKIGGSVPVPTVTSTNTATAASVQYHDVGIILKYTPRISEDGSVQADLHMEVSSPIYVDAMQAYKFNKRSVDTSVRLKNGETMVIGGLMGREESESISKVPFLSEIPVLGKIFTHKEKSRSQSEIMIFLTANLID